MQAQGTLYTVNQAFYFSADELEVILKQAWGYDLNNPLEVIGTVKRFPTYCVLVDLRNLHNGTRLVFPLSDDHPKVQAIICKDDQQLLTPEKLYKAELRICSIDQRRKEQNPFLLSVVPQKIIEASLYHQEYFEEEKKIKELQIELTQKKIKVANEISELEKQTKYANEQMQTQLSVIEQEFSDKKQNLNNEYDIFNKQLEQEFIEKRNLLEEEHKNISEQVIYKYNELDTLQKDFEKNQKAHEAAYSEYDKKLKNATKELEMLKAQLQNISKKLLLLGLIDKDITIDETINSDMRNGVSFEEIGGTYTNAIAYVQAFMDNKGIKYPRKLLENYFTLLSTHDLIILAGDSGSGKTNLVKSFAQAIGGQAKIIPVKPNWTSAEDLLGYYNPIEQTFLSTPFLDALKEAKEYPNTPYFICLDEMNLARVEYYFADFLSLLESRDSLPLIPLCTSDESDIIEHETKNFISIVDKAHEIIGTENAYSFIDIMNHEELNAKLHTLCGLRHGDSLLKYHSYLRKRILTQLKLPQTLELPSNVRFIGAINIDETTHYLSPKVLDRAHIIRFDNPLLMDFDEIENEVENFEGIDITQPLLLTPNHFAERKAYPPFNKDDNLVVFLRELVKEYLAPLGIEFSYRTIGQSCLYRDLINQYGFDEFNEDLIKNNIILQKILPKFLFDGYKKVKTGEKRDIVKKLKNFLAEEVSPFISTEYSCVEELEKIIENAENNDWHVNYWTK